MHGRPVVLEPGEKPEDGGRYLMYHGTRPAFAALIEQGGFSRSSRGLLGPGVYVSRDMNKARKYGSTILEVMVSVGKVCRADKHPEMIPRGDGRSAPWHDDGGFDTVWVPPDCPASVFVGAHFSEGIVEEDCVWDPLRVKVMGRAEDKGDEMMALIRWCFDEAADSHGDGSDATGMSASRCHWVEFPEAASFFIESHYRAWKHLGGQPSTLMVCGQPRKLFHRHTGTRYRVFFDRMVEQNVQTASERRIMRVETEPFKSKLKALQAVIRRQLSKALIQARQSASVRLQASWRGSISRVQSRLCTCSFMFPLCFFPLASCL